MKFSSVISIQIFSLKNANPSFNKIHVENDYFPLPSKFKMVALEMNWLAPLIHASLTWCKALLDIVAALVLENNSSMAVKPSSHHIHLELGKQQKVTIFYIFYVKRRICIFNTKNLYRNNTR
jgi:hypothetical protein